MEVDGIEIITKYVEYILSFFHKVIANLVYKIGFEVAVEMAKVTKVRFCSNYFEIIEYKLEIVYWDLASYLVDKAIKFPWSNKVELF